MTATVLTNAVCADNIYVQLNGYFCCVRSALFNVRLLCFVDPELLTFEEAFKGKLVLLAEKLEVSDKLLRLLKDANILNDHHVAEIRIIQINSSKVDKLIDILRRRDDRQVKLFCDKLTEADQAHVVKILLNTKPNSSSK